MPMHQKQVMVVLTLRWVTKPGELENVFEMTSLCLLSIVRTPPLPQLDIFGNISALLGPFVMSCIMVFEALVSFPF